MTKLTRETVQRVARLAKLGLSDAELETFSKQLGDVLVYMERLNEAKTDGVEPTSHVVSLENVLREDLPTATLAPEGVLGNAPESRDGLFLVPRVIEDAIER